jgi:thymidylate synthase (FAD)
VSITFTSDITVELVDSMGDDRRVVAAARVSTGGSPPAPEEDVSGLIRYLMKYRHGTPFEHGSLTFRVHAPAFVWWEWVRHRVGWSYNLESGRYKELAPVFWVPRVERPVIPAAGSKSARPAFVAADAATADLTRETMMFAYGMSYRTYLAVLSRGVAREVARSVLGFGVYYSGYATCNPRSLMHFLSLRTHDERAAVPSYPQQEIEEAARQCETIFAARWPVTYAAFVERGRVAP